MHCHTVGTSATTGRCKHGASDSVAGARRKKNLQLQLGSAATRRQPPRWSADRNLLHRRNPSVCLFGERRLVKAGKRLVLCSHAGNKHSLIVAVVGLYSYLHLWCRSRFGTPTTYSEFPNCDINHIFARPSFPRLSSLSQSCCLSQIWPPAFLTWRRHKGIKGRVKGRDR